MTPIRAITSDVVHLGRAVPSQINWTGASDTSWSTAADWTVAGGATQRVPLPGDTPTFNNPALARTVNLNGSQTVGSLWFNSSNSYSIAPGSGGALALSNTAVIWIDAGLHTITAPLSLGGSLTVDAEPGGNVAPASIGLTISGQVSGNSALIKTGAGILFLNNTNNLYTGNTSVTGGTLSAAAPGSLGTSGTVTINNATLDFNGAGTFARPISLTGAASNVIQADAGAIVSGPIVGPGGLTKTGNGTLILNNPANSFNGANVAVGTLQIGAATAVSGTSAVASGATLDLNGFSPVLPSIFGVGTVTNNKASTTVNLTSALGVSATYAAAIQDGLGKVALSVSAGSTLTLTSPNNSFSAGTTVSGGTLSVSADGNLGAGNGGLLLSDGVLQGAAACTLNSGRNITLSGNTGFDVLAGQTLAVAGPVSGAGSLTKTNSGRLLLSGAANSFSGNVTIGAGTLAVAADGSLGNSGGTVTINAGTLEFTSDTTTARTVNLVSSQSYLQVDSGTVVHNGLIAGPGGLVKIGPGTLSVTNTDNSYSGQTSVAAGTLLVNDPTGLALGSGAAAVQVFSGAQLAGTGTVSLPVTCSGGTVAPGFGTTIGTLYLQQGLALNNGSGVTFKLSNQLSMFGTPLGDAIDFEPALTGNPFGPIGGLQASFSNTIAFTGTPVPITTAAYTLFDHYHTTNGNPPRAPET